MIHVDPIILVISMSVIVGACCMWLFDFWHHRLLRRQHHTQLQLLHNTPVGLCYDLNGQISVNKTWCLMWDLARKPHTFTQLLNHLDTENRENLVRHYNTLKQKNTPFDILIQRGKQNFYLRGRPFEEGAFLLWLTDISRPQEKFNRLQDQYHLLDQQKKLLENAWESFPFPTFIRSNDNKVIFANQAVGKNAAQELNDCHWQTKTFQTQDSTFVLTYGQTMRTEEELQSLVREITVSHRRLCQELPCAICLFDATGQLVACSPAFANLWKLKEEWLNTNPDYNNFWNMIQENGLLSRVMDFSKYKQQQCKQFSELSKTEEIFLYLPNGKIIRRLMIPFAQGGVILLDEDKTA